MNVMSQEKKIKPIKVPVPVPDSHFELFFFVEIQNVSILVCCYREGKPKFW